MAKRRYICDVPGCEHERKRWQRLCHTCFRALPGDVSQRIRNTFRFGAKAEHREACRFARLFLDEKQAREAVLDDSNSPWMMRD